MNDIEGAIESGAMVVSRIEIIEAYAPDGSRVVAWSSQDHDGNGMEITHALGLIERVKMEIYRSAIAQDHDEEDDQ